LNNPEDIEAFLKCKTVAVVGVSRHPAKDAHTVPAYLKKHGFQIIPVNPAAREILGTKCYGSLLNIPADVAETVELVNVFRPSEDVPPIIDQAVELRGDHQRLTGVWMQQGISNKQGADKARRAGLRVVQDACIRTEHLKSFR